ncbi:MAG: hypothetical protein ACK5RC_10995 [Curvibacter sp.]|nr:hypothetical protein [Curvibacter sp.]
MIVHKNLDDFHVWQAKYRHWLVEVAESDTHEVWVSTRDLRALFASFPDDQRLKSLCASFLLYARDLKTHFITDAAMQRIMGQVPRLKNSPDVLKFLDWFERNVSAVARNKRRNHAQDEGNAIARQRSPEVMLGPVPYGKAPPHLNDPTEPADTHEQWRRQAAPQEPPRVYRPELRPMVLTWPQWWRLKLRGLGGYVLALWRGERSLFETLFVGLLVGGTPWRLLDLLLPEDLDFTRDYVWVYWVNALMLPVALACAVWLAVSLARSTRRSLQLRGGVLWATTVFLLSIPLVPLVAGNGWDLQMLEEWWAMVRGRSAPAYVYADPHLGRIVVRGAFRSGSAEAFEAVVKANPSLRVVQIESPGGYVLEGFRMAQLIEARKLDTVSFEGCYSACTFLLVAGQTRYLGPQVKVGFHRSGRKYGPVGDGWSWADHQIARYYESRGVQREFIVRALTPSIRGIWVAPHAQMYEAGYATLRWSERPAGV